jgi:hypothetical protein
MLHECCLVEKYCVFNTLLDLNGVDCLLQDYLPISVPAFNLSHIIYCVYLIIARHRLLELTLFHSVLDKDFILERVKQVLKESQF